MGGDLLDHKARLEDAEGTEKEMPFHVFVVDDEKNISDTMAAILRASGFVATPLYQSSRGLELRLHPSHRPPAFRRPNA